MAIIRPPVTDDPVFNSWANQVNQALRAPLSTPTGTVSGGPACSQDEIDEILDNLPQAVFLSVYKGSNAYELTDTMAAIPISTYSYDTGELVGAGGLNGWTLEIPPTGRNVFVRSVNIADTTAAEIIQPDDWSEAVLQIADRVITGGGDPNDDPGNNSALSSTTTEIFPITTNDNVNASPRDPLSVSILSVGGTVFEYRPIITLTCNVHGNDDNDGARYIRVRIVLTSPAGDAETMEFTSPHINVTRFSNRNFSRPVTIEYGVPMMTTWSSEVFLEFGGFDTVPAVNNAGVPSATLQVNGGYSSVSGFLTHART